MSVLPGTWVTKLKTEMDLREDGGRGRQEPMEKGRIGDMSFQTIAQIRMLTASRATSH